MHSATSVLLGVVVVLLSTPRPSEAQIPLIRKETRRKRFGGSLSPQIRGGFSGGNTIDGADMHGLSGWKSNVEYYAQLSVGSPPQSIAAQVDTATNITMIPSQTCYTMDKKNKCTGAFETPLDFNKSTTVTEPSWACRTRGNCDATLYYLDDAQYTGVFASDTVTLASLTTKLDILDAQEVNRVAREGLGGAGAVIGLAPCPLRDPSCFLAAVQQSTPGFRRIAAFDVGAPVPTMYIGGALPDPPPQLYFFHSTTPGGFTFRANAIGISSGATVPGALLGDVSVDVGGPLLVTMPTGAYRLFRSQLQTPRFCGNVPSICATPSFLDINAIGNAFVPLADFNQFKAVLPPLEIELTGVVISLSPDEYTIQLPCVDGAGMCVAFAVAEHTQPNTILGDLFARQNVVVFDQDAGVVGIGPKDTLPAAGNNGNNDLGARSTPNDVSTYAQRTDPADAQASGMSTLWLLASACAVVTFMTVRSQRDVHALDRVHVA